MPEHLRTLLRESGYKQPTLIQKLLFEHYFQWKAARENGDKTPVKIMARAPTGSGKTLCFMLPILDSLLGADGKPHPHLSGKTTALVVLPTRELATQMGSYMKKLLGSLEVKYLELVKGAETQSVTHNVVFGTPGTVLKFIDLAKKRKITWDMGALEYYVLDEADNLLEGGFENDTKKIRTAVKDGPQIIQWLHDVSCLRNQFRAAVLRWTGLFRSRRAAERVPRG